MSVRLVQCAHCKQEFDINTVWCNVGAEPWYECKRKCVSPTAPPPPAAELRPAAEVLEWEGSEIATPSFFERIQLSVSSLFSRSTGYKIIKQD